MTKGIFDHIVIIGYGKITGEVISYVHAQQEKYGYSMEFIEYEIHPVSITHKICTDEGIAYSQIPEKEKVTEKLLGLTKKTLIISASNNYLFPASVVEKENITVINFHNALLPKFPGRNAPSWAMYAGETETGITWHYVTPGVDDGAIIIQKKTAILPDMKAYELAAELMKIAFEGFKEAFDGVVAGTATVVHQVFPPNRKIYFSKMVPGEGVFSLEDTTESIYLLLRSTDYGLNDIFPHMKTTYNGKTVEIVRYRKITPDKQEDDGKSIYLPFADGTILKLKYKEI